MTSEQPNLTKSHTLPMSFARVLLVDADPASRITLRAVLEAGGYSVQTATTTVEAIEFLDSAEFELVLCNAQSDPAQIDEALLSYARFQSYEPATAVLTSVHCAPTVDSETGIRSRLLIQPENLPDLLDQIAALVGERVFTHLERELEAERRPA